MPLESFEVSLSIRKDRLEEAAGLVGKLFTLWRAQADECEWESTVGVCELIMAFNKQSGEFVFITGGERDVQMHIADETSAMLRDIGLMAVEGAMVRHSEDGRQANFPIGPSPASKGEAVDRFKLEKAVEALEAARTALPSEAGVLADKLVAAMKELVAS